jgi:hypothetical protein
VLERFEFPYQVVSGADVHRGDLRDRYDVLLFHTGLPGNQRPRGRGDRGERNDDNHDDDATTTKILAALPPFEDWSVMKDRRVRLSRDQALPALRAFVEAGGVLLCFDDQATILAEALALPVREGLYREDAQGEETRLTRTEFYCPGSLLRLETEAHDFTAFGVPERLCGMFRNSPVFALSAENPGTVRVVARYAAGDCLASGWAIGQKHLGGKAAVLRAEVGRGQVFLFGADVIYRGQPHASFKLVFNAIQGGSARPVAAIAD